MDSQLILTSDSKVIPRGTQFRFLIFQKINFIIFLNFQITYQCIYKIVHQWIFRCIFVMKNPFFSISTFQQKEKHVVDSEDRLIAPKRFLEIIFGFQPCYRITRLGFEASKPYFSKRLWKYQIYMDAKYFHTYGMLDSNYVHSHTYFLCIRFSAWAAFAHVP